MAIEVKKIRQLYLKALKRYPSSTEITYWLQFLSAGGKLIDVSRDLTQTHEFDYEVKSDFLRIFKRQPQPSEIVHFREEAVRNLNCEEALA